MRFDLFFHQRWLRGLAGAAAAVSLLAAPLRGQTSGSSASSPAAAAAARALYSQKAAAGYNYEFGAGHPFLPSNMTTDNGEFIDPQTFPSAEYCGHCHQASYAQWRQSAHSNSVRAPWYLYSVNMLNDERGISFSRHCEGCHNPVALAAGALTDGKPRTRPYDDDGITCMVCHSIQSVSKYGTGGYVLAQPAVLLDANGKPIYGPVSDAEILAHLDRHDAAVMKPLYKTPEFCEACHKAALPRMENLYKWQRAFTVYDEWRASSFSQQSPLPFYTKPVVSTCQTCHMKQEPLTSLADSGAKDGKLASHRWVGANTLIPYYYHFDEQMKQVIAHLQDQALNVDIFAVEPDPALADQSKLIAPLGTEPFQLHAGQRVVVSVVIQNKGIGHSLVPEQRDFYQAWVAFTVKDSNGAVIAHSGYLEPNGHLDPGAHSFTNRLINRDGQLNHLHQVWDTHVVAFDNTIQSGRAQVVRYAFNLPRRSGAVTVTAAVLYRRFDQHFINRAMKEPKGKHYSEPVIQMASATRTLQVGLNPATPPLPDENPEWMRWNNYGIALLDAQQFAAAVNAFEHVAELRPKYSDAPANIGITLIQWEKYNDAEPYLERSLSLDKDNARTLYYLALVQRNQGRVNQAIDDLKRVVAQFPQSVEAHRELGFSYYQEHKYKLACAEYEYIQSIDPDNLSAHYNLAILYRRLGMRAKSKVQEALFADEKADPSASAFALQYLRQHPHVARESVPWHVHNLEPAAPDQGGLAATSLERAKDSGEATAMASDLK